MDIFRKAALEKLASPEQLDLFTTFTSPRGWLALFGLGCLVFTLVLWGFYGSIPSTITSQGMLVGQGGTAAVSVGLTGQITDIKVSVGDMVQQGEVVARIFDPQWTQNSGGPLEEQAVTRLREKIERASQVVSPFMGRVLEINVVRGEWVKPGAPVLRLEVRGKEQRDLEAVFFVPIEEGKTLRPGLEVQVAPATVRKEEYGFMQGRVRTISEFPATPEAMLRVLGSQELVNRLAGQGAPVEVHVELIPAENTRSGYKWSSGEGPPLKINSGTLCQGQIIIKRVRPIELMFSPRDAR